MASPKPQQFNHIVKGTKIMHKRNHSREPLRVMLFKDGSTPTNVAQRLHDFLNNYSNSKKLIPKWDFVNTIRKLRSRKLYSHALKLSEAMDSWGMNKTVSDQAIHLDLISKNRGVSAAESYFSSLTETSRSRISCGPLLNCYCKEMMIEKAEALMEKIKVLNLPLEAVSYNTIMNLYVKIGQPEKVPGIVREMKSNNVVLDSHTYNIWMKALADVGDISGVEKVVEDMERDKQGVGWSVYSNLASIYVNFGLFDKAEQALKVLETKSVNQDFYAFQYLITLFGRTGNLGEVYRVWHFFRAAFPQTANVGYLNMIQVLVKLNDLPGAEKHYREWESECLTYDIRIANVLIGAYAKLGLLEKAEDLKEQACRRGAKPNAKTWEIFMDYYLKNGDIKVAVDSLASAISTGKGDGGKWVPSPDAVRSIMCHFEQTKDVDGAEGFIKILKKAVVVDAEVYDSLTTTYAAAAGGTSPVMCSHLKTENIDMCEADKKLPEAVSRG